jgi:hypothetical protein
MRSSMKKPAFFDYAKRHLLTRKYVTLSILFGLTTLIIPLAVQYLVYGLALTGIWLNTIAFIAIISLGLFLSHALKYAQIILTEYIQRDIFVSEVERWRNVNLKKSRYFFEIPALLKSFSKSFSSCVDLALILVFGLATIISFHPAFLVLPIAIGTVLYLTWRTFSGAVETSIEESNLKYQLHTEISFDASVKDATVDEYLRARDSHFQYIKSSTKYVGALYIFCQLFLLGMGIFFIQIDQLSIGQLVSAEIIMSNVMGSLLKLPQTLEALYDFETGHYKLDHALEAEYE